MTAVNVSGTFKKDQRPFCGLEAIADDLLDETQQRRTHFVVAEVRSHGYKFTAEDGIKTPTVKFDHIEVVLDDADMKTVKDLLTKIYAGRTGGEVPAELPYDAEGWAADEPAKGTKKK